MNSSVEVQTPSVVYYRAHTREKRGLGMLGGWVGREGGRAQSGHHRDIAEITIPKSR